MQMVSKSSSIALHQHLFLLAHHSEAFPSIVIHHLLFSCLFIIIGLNFHSNFRVIFLRAIQKSSFLYRNNKKRVSKIPITMKGKNGLVECNEFLKFFVCFLLPRVMIMEIFEFIHFLFIQQNGWIDGNDEWIQFQLASTY